MEALQQICADEGIAIEYVQLSQKRGILGWYCHDWDTGEPLILLDYSVRTSVMLHRCVLAEEVGHHMVGVRRTGTDVRWQNEGRAMRWAVNYLVPTEGLAAAAKAGTFLHSELAEHFNVPEWVIWRKFHVLRQDLREQHKLRVSSGDILSPLLVSVMWGQAV